MSRHLREGWCEMCKPRGAGGQPLLRKLEDLRDARTGALLSRVCAECIKQFIASVQSDAKKGDPE